MSDGELHDEYQAAKSEGPVTRIDDLQLEICQRWEDAHRAADASDDDPDPTLAERVDGVAEEAFRMADGLDPEPEEDADGG